LKKCRSKRLIIGCKIEFRSTKKRSRNKSTRVKAWKVYRLRRVKSEL
jgi:hypothetical protein